MKHMNNGAGMMTEKFFLVQGNVLAGQGRLEEAVIYFKEALTINPASFIAYFCLGKASGLLGDVEASLGYYKSALKINPKSIQTLRGLYDESRKICQWERLTEIDSALTLLIKKALDKGMEPEEMPYESVIRTDDKELNFRTAKWWGEYISQKLAISGNQFSFEKRRQDGDRIRVGYLSADFREHPVMRLLVDVFSLHDRKKFKVYAYSFGHNDNSYYRKKVERDSDKFVELVNFGVIDRARMIYEDKIDILVDLMGFTGDARPEVLALRPVPIQISYLGFPGSTGMTFLDYIITDKVLTPIMDQKFYCEKFLYINPCYQINSWAGISHKKISRKDFGLPEKGFVFCSFNATHKIEPTVFSAWMNILSRVPGSVLWLYLDNDMAKENLIREAQKRGVSGKRLVFVGKHTYPEYLRQLELADLALDTMLYTGGATTSDMLRMNVPVITMLGNHYLSRMSSSLLMAMGLSELVAKSVTEYEELAVDLAINSKRRELLVEKLKQKSRRKRLFDTKQFVTKLEKAYQKIHRHYLNSTNIS